MAELQELRTDRPLYDFAQAAQESPALRAAEQRITQLEARVQELEADLRLMPTADVLAGRVGQVAAVLRGVAADLLAVQRAQRGEG